MPVNSFDDYPLSWKPDKAALTKPYYLSLAADLEQRIVSGELRAGTKLPPQREIADYLDINYTTITRVYELLKKKGLIYGTVGRGTFVSSHADEDITVIPADLSADIIEMSSVNGFSEDNILTEKATRAVIEKGYLKSLYDYSFPGGQPHQIAAGIRWMEQLSVHADKERTLICAGAQNALSIALVSLFSPHDRIAVDPYTYSNFIGLARLLHITLIPVEQDEEGMWADSLEQLCQSRRLRGIYLMPTCANPTNVTISLERRRELARIIREYHLILIEDDVSAWLHAAAGTILPSMHDLLDGHSVCICGMTKSLCAGLRVAYMTAGEEYFPRLLHGQQNMNIKTSALDAEIITEMILNGDANRLARQKLDQTVRACELYRNTFGSGEPVSYYQWLPIDSRKDYRIVEDHFLRHGVRVYHSARFAVSGGRDAFLRVSLSSAGSARRLETGLMRLQEALQDLPR